MAFDIFLNYFTFIESDCFGRPSVKKCVKKCVNLLYLFYELQEDLSQYTYILQATITLAYLSDTLFPIVICLNIYFL